jgi:uncharacterized membrane protein HdeD (DUF308 family)
MNPMLIGAVAMGSIVAGLFFLRSWNRTKDRLFFFFAISFFLEGINRFALGMSADPDEGRPSFYVIRFISYLLIIIGIIDKNRTSPGGHPN